MRRRMQERKAGRVGNKCIWLEGGEGGGKGGQSSGEKWKKCKRKGVKELKLGASIIYWGGGVALILSWILISSMSIFCAFSDNIGLILGCFSFFSNFFR